MIFSKIKNLSDKACNIGLLSFLVLISIGFVTTNDASRLFVVPVRYISIVGVLLSAAIILFLKKYNKSFFLAGSVYVFLVLYAIVLSALNNVFDLQWDRLIVNTIVSLFGVLFISVQSTRRILNSQIGPYVVYVILGVLVTYLIGGVDLSFPPHFNFDYSSDASRGVDISYSQGASQFFGIGAIAAAYAVSIVQSKLKSSVLFFVYLVFIALSLLGGARGDSVAALIISIAFLMFRFRLLFLLALFLAAPFFYIYLSSLNDLLDGLVIFQRLESIGSGDLGSRDFLLRQSLQVFGSESRCLVVGCGFEYFQKFHGYEYGMYPHNFLVESIIVYGLPISLFFGLLVLRGVFLYFRKINSVDFFMLYFFYAATLSAKSGALFASWFFTSASMYFAALTISECTKFINIFQPHVFSLIRR